MKSKLLFPILTAASAAATVAAFALDSEFFMLPLVMVTEIIIALWLFRPGKESSPEGKAAFAAIIAFGAVSVLMSFALSLLVPVYGQAWGLEVHPEDLGGVIHPAVNDGRENCALGSIVYLIYFGINGWQRLRKSAKAKVGVRS